MKYKIYYEVKGIKDGLMYDDNIVITGDTIEEIREKTKKELDSRGAKYTGSEKMPD